MTGSIFPKNLPEKQWVKFQAYGYKSNVCGVINRNSTSPAVCGVPLGGIDTGCIDIDTSGLLGYCSIFNSHVPRRGPINLPLFGLNIKDQTWVFCDPKKTKNYERLMDFIGNKNLSPMPPVEQLKMDDILFPEEIYNWGHYPVTDMEFDTFSPVSVSIRCWSPFIPGDTKTSMLPGCIFEAYLANDSDKAQEGSFAVSFPGPTHGEADSDSFVREIIVGEYTGVWVKSDKAEYTLGIINNDEKVRFGGELGAIAENWINVSKKLPDLSKELSGTSVAVDFNIEPGQKRIIRFVLSWFSPVWRGGGTIPSGTGNTYTHMYAKYYTNALNPALILARDYEKIFRKIVAWQETIYSAPEIPEWLSDVLVNNFHLITEVGIWAQKNPPIGDWCLPEDGIWALNESPRGCPQYECGGNSYYGGMAVLYFFPELTLSTLRAVKQYMFANGCPPWIFGGGKKKPCELVSPTYGYQTGQNGSWYVGMVARYWKRTGSDDFLREFYPSVKSTTIFTMNLNKNYPYGLISLPNFDRQESFESTSFEGMSSHVGGIRLYHLRMAEEMAEKIGDTNFAEQCREWFKESARLMEEYLWFNSYYIQSKSVIKDEACFIMGPTFDLSSNNITKDADRIIMSYCLDGEFMKCFDGVSNEVFPNKNVNKMLTKLMEVSMDEWGPKVWTNPDGSVIREEQFNTGYWTPHGVHAPSALMLAMTFMYKGFKEYGMQLAEKVMSNMICRNGWAWDMPILYSGDTGKGIFGNDYSQMMVVWDLPAAIAGKSLEGVCHDGELIDRIIRAGKIG